MNIDFFIAGDRVAQFLTENLKAKVSVLNSVLNKDDSKTALSKRNEHPEWFEDLETNYTTKVRHQETIVSLATFLVIFSVSTKRRTEILSI